MILYSVSYRSRRLGSLCRTWHASRKEAYESAYKFKEDVGKTESLYDAETEVVRHEISLRRKADLVKFLNIFAGC